MCSLRKYVVLSGCLAISAGLLPAVHADSDSQQFQVKLTVTSTCDIHSQAATDVDFGSHTSTESNITATGGLTVNCTRGTPYAIALDNGENYGSGHRSMKNAANGDLVGYMLYQDAARTNAWGSTEGTDTLQGTGTGLDVAVPVYGTVLTAGTNLQSGDYVDNVTATVTY